MQKLWVLPSFSVALQSLLPPSNQIAVLAVDSLLQELQSALSDSRHILSPFSLIFPYPWKQSTKTVYGNCK